MATGDSHGCGSETGRQDGDGIGSSGCVFISLSPEGDGYGCDMSISDAEDGNGYGSGFTLYAAFANKRAPSGDGQGFDENLSNTGANGASVMY